MTMHSKCLLSVLVSSLALLGGLPLRGQESGAGYLKAHIDPGRAGVFVDGKLLGPAANFKVARKYALAAGQHEVKIVDPRFEEYTTTVTIEAGRTAKIHQKLKPIPLAQPPFGILRTQGFDKFSAVYINGKFYGHTDEFNNLAQGLLLNPGQYELKIVSPSGTTTKEEKIVMEADKKNTVRMAASGS